MTSMKMIIALASATITLMQAGCVSFESDVFSATPATAEVEEKPAMLAQVEAPPVDDIPSVDLALISPR